MKRFVCGLTIVFAACFAGAVVQAQDVAAVTGVVSDTSGAVIAGADIALVNTTTGASYHAKTNAVGSYRVTSALPGPGYELTFTMDGFGPVVVKSIYLTVATTRTQNATLKPGGMKESVVVSAANSEVTLDTTDAQVGNNFDVKLLDELPVQLRDTPESLFYLQPGVSRIPGSTTEYSVTGARTDQTYVTVDGLDVNDISTGQSFVIVANAPVDSVEEFKGTVAGQLADSGPGGGGQYQLVTKSGTNRWHGNVNEYHRDTSTVANKWFNNNSHVPLAHYVRNQFGGNVGGPIKRDKAFFFFNYYALRVATSSSEETTVPLDNYRNGNISYINNTTDPATSQPCGASSRLNVNPSCISSANASQIQALDPQNIGFSNTIQGFFGSRYPHANDLTFGDGINTGGYRFNAPTPDSETNYVARFDYAINQNMKFFAKYGTNREDSIEFPQVLPGDPVASNPFTDRSYDYVVGHTWTIGANKVNQFYYGDTIEKFNFPSNYRPTGTTVLTFGDYTSFLGDPYGQQESQKRRLPIPMFRDDFNWVKGSHNIGFGGSFKFIKTESQQILDFNFLGLGLGPQLTGLDATVRPADIRPVGTTAAGRWDNAFSLALGHIAQVSTNYNYSATGSAYPAGTGHTRQYRYYQTELYFGDTWKMAKNLTLTYGLNYQYYSVPFETRGLESIQNFTFDKYFAARVQQSAAGISGDSTVPFITYNLGGKANNGPGLYQPDYKNFAPRVSFAYTPSSVPGLVINGGAGVVYDRTVVNALNFVQDQSSFLFQNTVTTNLGDTSGRAALMNDPRIGSNFNQFPANTAPTITKPYTPYVTGGSPNGLASGVYDSIIDPTLKTPYSIMMNAGIQQQLPGDMVLKISYVGRLGRRLLAQADASQLIDFPDTSSGQLMSSAFANLTRASRAGQSTVAAQPWFEDEVFPGSTALLYSYGPLQPLISNGDFADFIQALSSFGLIDSNVGMASQFGSNTFYTNKGFSSYNGLLTTLSKNMSHGLQFTFNYTWSHSMDNTSVIANKVASSDGVGFLCDVTRPRVCRGNSDFDVANVLNANFSYQLPIGRGKLLAGTAPHWAEELIGGWSVSGIPGWQSGQAFTAYSNAFLGGFASNAPAIFNGNRGAVAAHVAKQSDGSVNLFSNPALFADPTVPNAILSGPIGLNIGSRNSLRGPSELTMDAGLAKAFPLVGDRVTMKFRADAFNILNHPVFSLPGGNDITSSNGLAFGQITSTAVSPRVVQLAARIEF